MFHSRWEVKYGFSTMLRQMNARPGAEKTLESQTRKNTVDIRHTSNRVRGNKRRGLRSYFSRRDILGWISSMRYWYHTGRGQKMKDKITDWATENALTLIFITLLFVIQSVWIFIAVAFFGGSISGN